MDFPTNFNTLIENERKIRDASIQIVTSDSPPSDHLGIFNESLNMVFDLTTQYETEIREEGVLQYIGLRLFNSCTSSLKLMLSGYYQVSFSIQRDILEIRHLLDYFTVYPEKIIEWQSSSNSDRYRKFKPALLRDELDKRDGLKNDKRKKEYEMFCEFAAHASYLGFKLLRKEGKLHLGPFFKEKWLKSCLEELTKQTVLATKVYIQHFRKLPKEFEKPVEKYGQLFQEWKGKYPHFAENTAVPPD